MAERDTAVRMKQPMDDAALGHLEQHGYAMLCGIFAPHDMKQMASRLSAALDAGSHEAILRSRGRVYGSRNLFETFPEVARLVSNSLLNNYATCVLGPRCGIVRVLYFDKPPDRTWSLPWHRDQTIAVQRNDLPSSQFSKPTLKSGVPHVEASPAILARMLTLRIHLDEMHEANGPLSVIPGSHRLEDAGVQAPVELHAGIGDVLLLHGH